MAGRQEQKLQLYWWSELRQVGSKDDRISDLASRVIRQTIFLYNSLSLNQEGEIIRSFIQTDWVVWRQA